MIKNYIVIQNNTVIQKAYGTIENMTLLFPNAVIIEDTDLSINIGDVVNENHQVILPISEQVATLDQQQSEFELATTEETIELDYRLSLLELGL